MAHHVCKYIIFLVTSGFLEFSTQIPNLLAKLSSIFFFKKELPFSWFQKLYAFSHVASFPSLHTSPPEHGQSPSPSCHPGLACGSFQSENRSKMMQSEAWKQDAWWDMASLLLFGHLRPWHDEPRFAQSRMRDDSVWRHQALRPTNLPTTWKRRCDHTRPSWASLAIWPGWPQRLATPVWTQQTASLTHRIVRNDISCVFI